MANLLEKNVNAAKELAGKIIVTDAATGIAKIVVPADEAYNKYIEANTEGEFAIQPGHVAEISRLNQGFAVSGVLAAGEVAVQAFAKNADLKTVEVSFQLSGKDVYDVSVKRETATRNPATGETGIKYGSVKNGFDFVATGDQRGQMAAAYTHISNTAKSLYGAGSSELE